MDVGEIRHQLNTVLGELSKDVAEPDWERRVRLCREALRLLPREAAPRHWASLRSELGLALTQVSGARSGASSLELLDAAILAFESALEVQGEAETPEDWAQTQWRKGMALSRRSDLAGYRDLRPSIRALRKSLRVFRPEETFAEWFAVTMRLAALVQKQPEGADGSHLEEAVEIYGRVLGTVSPQEAPRQWASARINQAYVFFELFELTGDRQPLHRAVVAFEEGLKHLCRDQMPLDWAAAAMNYGSALLMESHRSEVVEKAMQAFQLADEGFSEAGSDGDRSLVLGKLAGAWVLRQEGDRAENLENAISTGQEALRLAEADLSVEAALVAKVHLGHAWKARVLGARAENQQKAREMYEQFLSMQNRQMDPVAWARAAVHLGTLLEELESDDKARDLEEALEILHQASAAIDQEKQGPEWANIQFQLGNLLVEKAQEEPGIVQRAIKAYEASVECARRSGDSQAAAPALNNLANAHRLLGDRESFQVALHLYRQVLETWTVEDFPLNWAEATSNLGVVYRDQPRGDRVQNVEASIELFEAARSVQLDKGARLDWAISTINLGLAFLERLLGPAEINYEKALIAFAKALEVFESIGHSRLRALTLTHMGTAFFLRLRGESAENLELSLGCYQIALESLDGEVYCKDRAVLLANFANVCSQRIKEDDAETLEVGLSASAQALEILTADSDPEHYATALYSRAAILARSGDWSEVRDSIERALEAIDLGRFPASRALVALRAGDLYFAARRWSEAIAAYRRAEEAALRLYGETETDLGREAEVAWVLDLFRKYAYCLARVGSIEKALLVLEGARSRRLQEFPAGTPRSLEMVRSALASGELLVYLVTVEPGSLALITAPVQSDSEVPAVKAVWLDGFAVSDLDPLLMRWHRNELVGGLVHSLFVDRGSLRSVLPEVLDQVGEALIGPLARELLASGCREILLVATGLLNLLPLHAASWSSETGENTLVQLLPVGYVPSALALASARTERQGLDRQRRVAGVGNPSSDGHPLLLSELELSQLELAAGTEYCQLLEEEEVTLDAVQGLLPKLTHLHLSCHGAFDARDPRRARLLLSGGDSWSLADILGQANQLQDLQLVFLSACETALAEFQSHPDEMLGFPMGFLQAGAPSVVGTLWSVEELSAALLVTSFYRFYFGKVSGSEQLSAQPRQALRAAQLWLRGLTVAHLIPFLEGEAALLGMQLLRGEQPKLDQELDQLLIWLLLEEEETRPFEHPYFWAGFVAVGA